MYKKSVYNCSRLYITNRNQTSHYSSFGMKALSILRHSAVTRYVRTFLKDEAKNFSFKKITENAEAYNTNKQYIFDETDRKNLMMILKRIAEKADPVF